MSPPWETVPDPPETPDFPAEPTPVSADFKGWQKSLSEAIRSRSELLRHVHLESLISDSCSADQDFPVVVPLSYIRRMRTGDPRDPLLLQVLPTELENRASPGSHSGERDPTVDLAIKTAPGLLHKYHGRALLIAHGSCAVHCRYCFRRHYPYGDDPKSLTDWQPALDAILSDNSLHEIILSGGDPLLLSDGRLKGLLDRLAEIPHVRRLRIHSRLPIVLPDRVTRGLLDCLRGTRFQTFVVVHANHAHELVDDCETALQQLIRSGIPVLNQAVLLRKVNDSVEALAELCERCIDLGVMPYYLHQLDRVRGAVHFEVDPHLGLQLISELRARLPGYAVPRYVREIPGERSKTVIESSAEGQRCPEGTG
ncbi:MAG: EF-P beta-lysylation protein EpmB [Planctomycetaceae bacterium]|nr:EF-P beta-lysylation protein EpmB [Planctomycetaceae bacterium]